MTRALTFVFTLLCAACEQPPPDLPTQIDDAIAAGERYLRDKQDDDGGWRSETYGTLTDGITLTPFVLKTLVMLGGDKAYDNVACRRGAAYLRNRAGDDGALPDDLVLDFPVYTASLSAITLSRLPGEHNRRTRDAWLDFLRRYQLDETLGWNEDDLSYGGWGYSVRPPKRPGPSAGMSLPFESDLSSTLFAVGALRLSGVGPDDPTIQRALCFVLKCQNFAEPDADTTYDDGGFFLSPSVPIQNKAGEAGVDTLGRTRFHSYGSATADGFRTLMLCGLPPTHPRVVAARDWLFRNFDACTNPGTFTPEREQDREAVYYYWCWSFTHAMRRAGVREFEGDGGDVRWPELLARELLARRRSDGIWRSDFGFGKEDDPLIATALATAALANCREMMGEGTEALRHEGTK